MTLLKIAWRNVWRNSRRTLITTAAIAFASLALAFTRGMQLGTYAKNIQRTVESFVGYIQIQREDYRENPSIQKAFVFDEKIKKIISQCPKIKSFAPRILGEGLAGNKKASFGVFIVGVDPDKEIKTTNLADRVVEGSFLSENDRNGIVIGTKLAENLKAKIGDEIAILANGYDGSLGDTKFKIRGFIKLGQPEIDKIIAIANIRGAKKLLSTYDKINSVVLSLKSLKDIPDVKKFLNDKLKKINAASEAKIAALDWGEELPEVKQSIEFDNVGGIIQLAILLIIVAFGVLNSSLMAIIERTKEFGVMLALGAKKSFIVALSFFETLFIALMGTTLGLIIAYFLNAWIESHPIYLGTNVGKVYENLGWIPAIYSTTDFGLFVRAFLWTVGISIVAFLIPAARLAKLQALKGIRYT